LELTYLKNTNVKSKKTKNSLGSDAFQGNIRLQLESADDYTQVNQFCEYLKTFRNLRIISYSWSESKGLIIIISLQESAPLGDMLRQIPMVEQVYKRRKNIAVVLNTTPPETASPLVTLSPEEALAS
jgi:hypothetical protein